MDYLKEYRSFISSHYLSEGVRITAGVLLPALIMGYYGMLPVGLTIALGSLCVSITDNPGPIQHRRNGFIVCSLLIFLVALLSGLAQLYPWAFFILLPVSCFFFSMIGVYGARATSIGMAALFVMVLQTEDHFKGWDILYNALYLLGGGLWYFLLSQVLYSLRPYKLIQQALGEYVMWTASYLKAKAAFYNKERRSDKDYENLLRVQITVQEKQNLVAELLFKTRSVVKESTHTSRVLMMVFLDVADLFERAMTSHQDYDKLHRYFDETGILEEYRMLILRLSDELDEIGIALKSGISSSYNKQIDDELLEERDRLQKLRLSRLDQSNLDGFISLRHILDSIDDIAGRIRTLHQYTSYDRKFRRKKLQTPDPEDFITHQGVDPKLLWDNLSFRSNIFRHSIRITAAAVFAFFIGQLLPIGHAYWVLLTVIVILKPAYSLTRKRNYQRIAGTIAGVVLAVAFLFLVHDKTAILITLIVSMIGAYSFMRKHYLVSVMLMTLYLLLMFRLLDPKDVNTILRDRIIDTAIGSVIAFLFSYLLKPIWEHEQINNFMSQVLRDAIQYYKLIAGAFTGEPLDKTVSNVARKNSWVSLANLSDAFNRMLSEPKSRQRNILHVHQFVVANHMLVSHVATLSYYTDSLEQEYIMHEYRPLIEASVLSLQQALRAIDETAMPEAITARDPAEIRHLEHKINEMMQKRKDEIGQGQIETSTRNVFSVFKSITDQFYFIYKVSADIQKISQALKRDDA
ncbi:FUSC family protein [Sediminibacterium ginsengisoli]|uniref:TIGR01666 family membrane protein n=1 Tax=Sediminibacterium ginsengisoli TaxID=413434 RepID=A0A1T4NKI2_9BACT|nr:FUSC family membrane protein [Sediminibacterium ginsengisoli]SJZ79780.1 TIGR01666 family membrane protein [Sediminibacterium ginsengisoli]